MRIKSAHHGELNSGLYLIGSLSAPNAVRLDELNAVSGDMTSRRSVCPPVVKWSPAQSTTLQSSTRHSDSETLRRLHRTARRM